MEQILELITAYGLETVVIALLINVLTGLLKMPIKALANKLKDYKKVTRFIVFLPILFGFLLTFCYAKFIQGTFNFDREFVTLWLMSSSLSLTFYAIFEKIFPSEKKLLSEKEIKTSETILENIKQLLESFLPSEKETEITEEASKTITDTEVIEETVNADKIILRGNVNAEVEAEK